MDAIPLKSLGIESKWPQLADLQAEVAGLERQTQQAENEVNVLQNELVHAREQDLNDAAAAARAGKKVPDGKHEADVQRRLEQARRNATVYRRAVDSATSDLGAFRTKHQAELYRDVVAAREEIALTMADAARAASVAYARHADLGYLVKSLTPPEPVAEMGAPAKITNSFIGPGLITTRSGAPDRGHVEGVLSYLSSLAEGHDHGQQQQGAA